MNALSNENGGSVEYEQAAMDIFAGNFQQRVPQVRPRTVRLFLASSKSDFVDERDIFWKEVLPELQQYCLQFGADLLLIDPFQNSHGEEIVNDLSDNPHFVQKLVEEIQECRDVSTGAYFVGFIGDKYGSPCLPVCLKPDELAHIRTAAFESGLDVRLLDDWYKLDSNALPPVYILERTHQKKKLDSDTRKSLVETIHKSASQAFNEGLINQVNRKNQERLFYSTIQLMCEAATSSKEASRNTLLIMRKFDGVKQSSKKGSHVSDDYFDRYSEDPAGLMNFEKRLSNFKNSLASILDKPNIENFRIPCTDLKGWLGSKDQEKYLDNLAQQLIYKLKQLIGAGFRDITTEATPGRSLDPLNDIYNEALTHVNLALNLRASNFVGHKDILTKIRELCREAQRKKGVLITIQGESCSGKTALLCEIAHLIRNWLSTDKVNVLPRFIGHSPTSVFVAELWHKLYQQASLTYGFPVTNAKIEPNRPGVAFNQLMEKLREGATKVPLIILLDDVHLIKYAKSSQIGDGPVVNLSTLPTNVIVIVTTADAALANVSMSLTGKSTSNDSKTKITMPKMAESELLEIGKTFLSSKKKKMTADQEGFLKQKLKESPSPFMSVMVASQIAHWPSYMALPSNGSRKSSENNSSNSLITKHLGSYVQHQLIRAEKEIRTEIIVSLCRYLEGSRYGLTEVELIDALSCNREVMDLIGGETAPSSAGANISSYRSIRFPVTLWLAIKRSLDSFFKYTVTDGRQLIWWSHSIIGTVVRQRYLQNSADIKRCHADLADIFSDLYSDSTINGVQRKDSFGSAIDHQMDTVSLMNSKFVHSSRPESTVYSNKFIMTYVFPQPLIGPALNGSDEPFFNFRRVRNLWYHLLNSGNVDLLKEQSLCNFLYLNTALQCCGLDHIVGIMEDTLQQVLHHDLHAFFHQVLLPSLPSIIEDKNQFAGEVIGRLRYTRAQNGRFLNGLVEQAMAWVDNYTKYPLLVPLTYWIRPQRRQLALSFKLNHWHVDSKTAIQPTFNHQHLLVAGQKQGSGVTPGTLYMYHIASNTMVRSFTGHTDRVTSLTLSHGGHFVVSTSIDRTVRTWDLIQGHCIRNLSPHSDKILCAILTKDDQLLITGSSDSSAKVSNLESGRVIRAYPDHTGPVYALALTHHDEFLITGSGDFVVRVWHMSDETQLFSRLGGLMAPVTCMSLTTNDAFLMVACEDETVRVFSLCSGTELHELRGHESKIHSLCIGNDDCQIFAGCADGNIYCYDLHTGEILEVFDCSDSTHDSKKIQRGPPVTSLKVTSDGWFLISASGDRLHVWNLEKMSTWRHSGRQRLTPMGSDSGIEDDEADMAREHLTCLSMSQDFRYSACGTKSGVIALWDLEVCQCVWTSVHDMPHQVTTVNFNPDATLVLSGIASGGIFIWDMGNGSQLRSYNSHEGPVLGIRVLSDNSRVLSFDSSEVVHIWPLWNVEDPDIDLLATFKGPKAMMEVSRNDHDIIGKCFDNPKEAGMWTMYDEGLHQKARMAHNAEITCIALSRNCRLLVTGSADESLKVWDGENCFLTQVLVGHEGEVVCCAVADDDKTVISAATDKLAIIWEVGNGTMVQTLRAHLDVQRQHAGVCKITAVGLSSDGSVGLTADTTGWLYAWSCDTGEMLTAFNAHLPIITFQMSADSSRIALMLERCPHLPILCLHNTPAGPMIITMIEKSASKKRPRTHSVTSTGSKRNLHGKISVGKR